MWRPPLPRSRRARASSTTSPALSPTWRWRGRRRRRRRHRGHALAQARRHAVAAHSLTMSPRTHARNCRPRRRAHRRGIAPERDHPRLGSASPGFPNTTGAVACPPTSSRPGTGCSSGASATLPALVGRTEETARPPDALQDVATAVASAYAADAGVYGVSRVHDIDHGPRCPGRGPPGAVGAGGAMSGGEGGDTIRLTRVSCSSTRSGTAGSSISFRGSACDSPDRSAMADRLHGVLTFDGPDHRTAVRPDRGPWPRRSSPTPPLVWQGAWRRGDRPQTVGPDPARVRRCRGHRRQARARERLRRRAR